MKLGSEPTAGRALKGHWQVPAGYSGRACCYLQILVTTGVRRGERHDQISFIEKESSL